MRRLLLILLACSCAHAGKLPSTSARVQRAEPRAPRAERTFGLGLSAGGPLSVVGLEIDFQLAPEMSVGIGYGTGIDYQTAMAKARYFILDGTFSPYLGGGVGRWWTNGARADRLNPAVLAGELLAADELPADGLDAWIVYPCIGVQLFHATGVAFFAELEYLFRIPTFGNGLYAGTGLHWYF